jgi:flagellar biosynthesis anti-sigma factor FlgM
MTELDPTNKIVQKSTAKKPPVRPARPPVAQANTSAASDRVSLSHKPDKPPLETGSAKASGHIREQLVSKFREVLEEGTYKVKADEIAKKMVQKIQEEKDQTII